MKTKDFRVLILAVVPFLLGVFPISINQSDGVAEIRPQDIHIELASESETSGETDTTGQDNDNSDGITNSETEAEPAAEHIRKADSHDNHLNHDAYLEQKDDRGSQGQGTDPGTSEGSEVVPDEKAPCIVIYKGDETKNEIAFTFDDTGANFDKILATLKEKEINGTFFLLTSEINNNPERWQQAVKDGNLICSHGTSHNFSLGHESEDEIRADIQEWEDAVTEVLGADYLEKFKNETPYFRIPGGNKTEKLLKVLGEMGYKYSFYWTAEDCWSTMPEHNLEGKSLDSIYISKAKPGAIFLLHPPYQKYVDEIIEGAIEKGYTFVTLDQWNDYYEAQANAVMDAS